MLELLAATRRLDGARCHGARVLSDGLRLMDAREVARARPVLAVVALVAAQHLLESATKLHGERVVENGVDGAVHEYHRLAEHQVPKLHVALLGE